MAGLQQTRAALTFQFIDTELELALTFYKLARSSRRGTIVNRNAANARCAFGTAARVFERAKFPCDWRHRISQKIERLRLLLAELDGCS
jgi:hypothetical protein